MRALINILWLIFGGGIVAALGWFLLSALLFITVIGIPFAVAGFRIGAYTLWPLGQETIDAELLGESTWPGTMLANIAWVLLAGIWLLIGHVVAGVSLCLTLIGIPFGLIHFKLAQAAFAPLGKRIVSVEEARAAREHAARYAVDTRFRRA